MPISAKLYRNELKKGGVFYTDPKLAEKMKSLLPGDVTEVYDPTCGDGALLSVFDDAVEKYGQDVLEDQVQYAREHLVNFHGVVGDTLTEPAFMDRKFRAIVANPPFSIVWEPVKDDVRFADAPTVPTRSKADYAFLMHIMYCLADDGTAVVLNAPGILFRGQREGKLREWFVRNNWIDRIIHVPGEYFEDTKIQTALLVLKKNRTTTDIQFTDWEHDMDRTVPLEEIQKKNFNLSVNMYIEADTKPVITKDPEAEIEDMMVNNLAKSLQLSWELGYDIAPLLDRLEAVLKEYREK